MKQRTPPAVVVRAIRVVVVIIVVVVVVVVIGCINEILNNVPDRWTQYVSESCDRPDCNGMSASC